MHPSVERFVSQAREEHDLEVEPRTFPEGTRTARDAAEALGCDLAQILKTIVMVADGDVVVCYTSGVHRVSEGKLAAHLGVDPDTVRPAKPDEVKAALGWSIGGVPPICHARDIPKVLDETLLGQGTLWAGAGAPDAVFPLPAAMLPGLTGAQQADVYDRTS